MPVSKKNAAKPSKVSKVEDPEDDIEDEVEDEEPDEVEEDSDDTEDEDGSDEDTDDTDDDDEENGDTSDSTATPPRGRGRPRGPNSAPAIPWDDAKDAALIKTMRRISSGKLPGAHPLTPAAVLSHLQSHEAFSGVAHLLTPSAIAGRAKSRAKALAKVGIEIPSFPVKVKPNISTLAALLEDDDED